MVQVSKPQIQRVIPFFMLIALFALSPARAQSQDGRPIAEAGLSRYAATKPVQLDGRGSYDLDNLATLSYTFTWRQIAGPQVLISDADTAIPTISSFVQTDAIQECEFELIVSNGEYDSLPDTVRVVVVPYFGESNFRLENKSFDPKKPTIIYFGGGDCIIGHTGQYIPDPNVYSLANVIDFPHGYTPDSDGGAPTYYKYGDMIIVYLSSVAPDYKQQISSGGFSTGGMPGIDVGIRLNQTYRDARYAVNRVAFGDATPFCRDYSASISTFLGSSVDGEQCWVGNYVGYSRRIYPGVLNVRLSLPHVGGVMTWYGNSLTGNDMNQFNNGVVAGLYWSVIGPGKNLQLGPAPGATYAFQWHGSTTSGYMDFFDESSYPGRLPEPVTLVGPEDGAIVDANGAVFSCEESENAVGYQLLFGPDPHRVMDYYIVSDTLSPPSEVIITSPFEPTWWTVKVYDQYGSTIYADPIHVNFEILAPPLIENLTTGQRYASIQRAIDDARHGHEIVVSPGGYKGGINFQGQNLTLRSTDPNDSAIVATTIIEGDGSKSVVTFSRGEDANCVLAGFTIMGGNAENGGGIYCGDNSTPTITDCIITNNSATQNGGGMYADNSSPSVLNCIFNGNSANYGGGVNIGSGNTTIINCTFSDNLASIMGGGIQNVDSNPKLINCSFSENSGTYFGGAISCSGGSPVLTNCILWGDTPEEISIFSGTPVITYSDIKGGFTGEGNIDVDPFFADPSNGDYHLKSQAGRMDPNSQSWIIDDVTSPCIDTGDPTSSIGLEPSPNGGRINMGTYGGTSEASKSP